MGQYNYSITAQLKKTDITPIFLSSLFPTFYTAVQQYKNQEECQYQYLLILPFLPTDKDFPLHSGTLRWLPAVQK